MGIVQQEPQNHIDGVVFVSTSPALTGTQNLLGGIDLSFILIRLGLDDSQALGNSHTGRLWLPARRGSHRKILASAALAIAARKLLASWLSSGDSTPTGTSLTI